jgi:hypothetical protein
MTQKLLAKVVTSAVWILAIGLGSATAFAWEPEQAWKVLSNCESNRRARLYASEAGETSSVYMSQELQRWLPKFTLDHSATGQTRGGYAEETSLGIRVGLPNPIEAIHTLRFARARADEARLRALDAVQQVDWLKAEAWIDWRHHQLWVKQLERAIPLLSQGAQTSLDRASASELSTFSTENDLRTEYFTYKQHLSDIQSEFGKCSAGLLDHHDGISPLELSTKISNQKGPEVSPRLRACEKRLEAAQSAHRMLQSQWLPGIQASYSRALAGTTTANPNDWRAGLEWSIPLGGIRGKLPEIDPCEFEAMQADSTSRRSQKGLELSSQDLKRLYQARARYEALLDSLAPEVKQGNVAREKYLRFLSEYRGLLKNLQMIEATVLRLTQPVEQIGPS